MTKGNAETAIHPSTWAKEFTSSSSTSINSVPPSRRMDCISQQPKKYHRIVDLDNLAGLSLRALRCFLIHLLYDHPDKPTGTWVAPDVSKRYRLSPSAKCRAMKELMIAGLMYLLEPGHTGHSAVYGINRAATGPVLSIQQIRRLLALPKLTVEAIRKMVQEKNEVKNAEVVDIMHVRRLPGVKELRNGELFVMRCPFCRDSKKDPCKMRGYFFQSKRRDTLMFKCHNCGVSGPMGWVMKNLGRSKEWSSDLFKFHGSGGTTATASVHKPKRPKVKNSLKYVSSVLLSHALPLDQVPADHPGRQYMLGRGCRTDDLFRFWYTEDASALAATLGVSTRIPQGPRICWILRSYKKGGRNEITAIETRSIVGRDYRRITLKKAHPDTISNLFWTKIKEGQPIHVVEGTFDALALPNSIAVHGADKIRKVADRLAQDGHEPILCFDNEVDTNPHIRELWMDAYRSGLSVLKWKPECPFKDLSEMYSETHRRDWIRVVRVRPNSLEPFLGDYADL